MARKSRFDLAFEELEADFTARTKRSYLDDLRGQLEEEELINEIVKSWKDGDHHLAVSFDRKKNDHGFSYPYFDLTLVALDRISGGTGIFKPVNQLRVIRWNSSRSNLLKVLRYLMRLNPQIKIISLKGAIQWEKY